MQRPPRVKSVMTPFPTSIAWEAGVSDAVDMMEKHDIRHLPVTRDGELFGVVSDADLRVSRAVGIERIGRAAENDLQVGLVCTCDPYVVDLETPLSQVADQFAHRQIGSALVTREGRLCGILTTTDICRYLSQLLREMFTTTHGNEAG